MKRGGIFIAGIVVGGLLLVGADYGWRVYKKRQGGGSAPTAASPLQLVATATDPSPGTCPWEGPEDLDGFMDDDECPDRDNDGDGIPDVFDGAPMEPEDVDGDRDHDGIPDYRTFLASTRLESRPYRRWAPSVGADATEKAGQPKSEEQAPLPIGFRPRDGDGDTHPDLYDLCPDEAEDFDVFEDQDGCPEPDNDNDGILDTDDKCPFIAGQDCDAPLGIKGKIFFATGSDKLVLPRSEPALAEVLQLLEANPQIGKVEIQGHTDNVGSDQTNLKLSNDRATSVQKYLVEKGLPEERLVPKGFGSTRAVMSNKTEAGRAGNRRVEFHVLSETDADSEKTETP